MTASAKVHDLITRLIEREGGYANHPRDRGGPTNWGITQATLSTVRGRAVSIAEVQALTQDEARAIYLDRYFTRPGFDAIADPELQELLFDYGVNSGPGQAAASLQQALKDMKLYTGGIDGVIGPLSRAAIAACNNVPELYYRTKCERYELFLRFIGYDHEQGAFATGWANRLDELQDAP